MIDGNRSFHQIRRELTLTEMDRRANEIKKNLVAIIDSTHKCAPVRLAKSYKLAMEHEGKRGLHGREACLERAIYRQYKYRPGHPREFLSEVCPFILAYQVPLRNSRSDHGWRTVDLMGASGDWLPVVVELKEEESKATPLLMLVEAAGYAVAIRKAWNDTKGCLREEWRESIERVMAASAPKCEWPDELQTVPIICAAPRAYWRQRRGKADVEPNALPKEAWKALADLMSALNDKGFPVTLVEFDAKKGVGDEPMIDQVASFAPPV